MRRTVVLSTLVLAGTAMMTVAACRMPGFSGSSAARIEHVKGNLYVITGSDASDRNAFSGGNTGVFVTAAGVVLVDTKLTGWAPVIMEKVRSVTDQPVTMIINTHSHADHTGGNPGFPDVARIVAHEKTRANMTAMPAFEHENARFLPTETFTDRLTVGTGGDRIELRYFGRSHTNGDAWVHYPELRVMQIGDVFTTWDAPVIDLRNGGSGVEYAATIAKALSGMNAVETLIGGHGPLRKPSQLKVYGQFVGDFVEAVRQARAQGLSAVEAAESIDLRAKYPDSTASRYGAAVQAIYDELTQIEAAASGQRPN